MSAVRKFYLWYVAQLHQVFRLKDVNNSISERGNLNCQTNCDNQKDVNNSTSKKCWWKRCKKHYFWGLRGVEMWHIITISLAIITVLIWYYHHHHHHQYYHDDDHHRHHHLLSSLITVLIRSSTGFAPQLSSVVSRGTELNTMLVITCRQTMII